MLATLIRHLRWYAENKDLFDESKAAKGEQCHLLGHVSDERLSTLMRSSGNTYYTHASISFPGSWTIIRCQALQWVSRWLYSYGTSYYC